MKKIDKLIITSFVPPFVVTFFIAIFVLLMQYLWIYIDDIIGKGAGLLFLMEMIFYMSVSFFPMALPIAILISSVMVMGNMAERYELTSMKSAGVPLLRIIRSLMFFALLISFFSFFCSNNLMPVANLKFKSRLYDVKKQKPTLNLEEGVFNNDFQDFIIRMGVKKEDNISIEDVLIYDQKENKDGKISQILAEKGKMYTTEDKRYFVMNLEDGTQYRQMKPEGKRNKDQTYPFVRTTFKTWDKVFDLQEFEINWTDRELFKNHYKMLTASQLVDAIDTLDININKRVGDLVKYNTRYFRFLQEANSEEKDSIDRDSSQSILINQKVTQNKGQSVPELRRVGKEKKQEKRVVRNPVIIKQNIDQPLSAYGSFYETLGEREHSRLLNRAKTFARSIKNQAESTNRILKRSYEQRVKHIFELHVKFSMSLVCFIFLFIGAPMGAIIRKGGFGYPILISILFFMAYIIMNITFKNVAEEGAMPAILAAWLPCLILFPIGLLLTYKAMNDSRLLDSDRINRVVYKVVARFRKEK